MNDQKYLHTRRYLKILAGIFIAAVAAGFYWRAAPIQNVLLGADAASDRPAGSAAVLATPATGGVLPPVSFFGPDGQAVRLEDFKGKYLLLNFWATWCGPCVVELPSMDALRERFQDRGLDVVAVSIDQSVTPDVLKNFLKSRGISDFALYHDTQGDVQAKIALPGIPVTYLLSPEGQIAYVFEGGADWTDAGTTDFFTRILDKT